MVKNDRWIAAICGAPSAVLGRLGMLSGKTVTCFPGCEKWLGPGAIFVEDRVVCDGKLITSRSAGTAMEFSLEIVKRLMDSKTALELSKRLLATP